MKLIRILNWKWCKNWTENYAKIELKMIQKLNWKWCKNWTEIDAKIELKLMKNWSKIDAKIEQVTTLFTFESKLSQKPSHQHSLPWKKILHQSSVLIIQHFFFSQIFFYVLISWFIPYRRYACYEASAGRLKQEKKLEKKIIRNLNWEHVVY
jgi:hypothetical protein